MSANIKEQAHIIVDALPDNATWNDLIEKIHRQQGEEQATQLAEMLESPGGFDQLSREASQLIQERERSMTEEVVSTFKERQTEIQPILDYLKDK